MKHLFMLLLMGMSFVAAAVQAQEAIEVRINTNQGNMVLELYPDKAPKTVENFLAYVDAGHYSGTVFHRVIDGFMIQGGGFDQEFTKKDTREPIENEAANRLQNKIGTIAMARTSDPHSATAQFFINVANNSFLDYREPRPRAWGYAVFGKVIQGLDTVTNIAKLPTGRGGPFFKDVPQPLVVIESIERL